MGENATSPNLRHYTTSPQYKGRYITRFYTFQDQARPFKIYISILNFV